jgi:hypothetical protein
MRLPTRRPLVSVAIVALFSVSAQSATLIVTNTQDAGAESLRATVAAAGAGDTIEFDIPRSDPGYNSSTGVFTITLTSGEIVINKDLRIAAPPGNIAISGNHASRIFNITAGIVAISDLSLIDGMAKGAHGENGTPGTPGMAGLGGAVLNLGTLTVSRCTFKGNTALGGDGGSGLSNATGGGDGNGGAIANQKILSLVACTLADNSALGGPGGRQNNTAGYLFGATGGMGSGGAIYNAATGYLSLSNCTVAGNRATGPDAWFMELAGHGAPAQGGGITNLGTLTIGHCTVANNAALAGNSNRGQLGAFGPYDGGISSGGGLYCASNSVTTIRDAILAPNRTVGGAPSEPPAVAGAATGPDVNGAVTSEGHNLLGRSDGCTGFTMDDLQGGTTDESRLDPKLGPLGAYGGPTETLSLLPGSPAIDGGEVTVAPSRDQRCFVSTGPTDIGAFEYQGREPTPLGNISTRLRVQTGDNAMIGGFIVTGTEPKRVIVRGIGPSLAVPGPLADPIIEIHGPSGELIAVNDNWRDAETRPEIMGSGLSPTSDLESALWGTMNPGAYTVVVRGKNGETGTGLFEVYDLDRTVDSKLSNISTRGFVDTGDNVMVGGTIIIGGPPVRVLFRALGPSLSSSGVPDVLEDPAMELYGSNGELIAVNYNWRDDQEAEIIATGIPPLDNMESAIVRDLAPGPYTAIVRGTGNTTGNAVIEVYDLN